MKKKLKVLFLCLLPYIVSLGQNQSTIDNDIIGKVTSNINFIKASNWKDLRSRAKKEGKFVFIDCYATWCKPCKLMDSEVFTDDSVSRFFNENFISIKIQMDKTKNDSKDTKQLYDLVDELRREYNIQAYPTYVFLSPDWKILNKVIGYTPAQTFLKIGKDVVFVKKDYKDPLEDFNIFVNRYRNGVKDYAKMGSMALIAKSIQNNGLFDTLAKEYSSYLNSLKDRSILTKTNISFISATIDSNNRFIKLFYPNGKKVDSIMNMPGYSTYVVDSLIQSNLILPAIHKKTQSEPNWDSISKKVQSQYGGDYEERNVLWGKILWHHFQQFTNKDYSRWTEYRALFYKYLTGFIENKSGFVNYGESKLAAVCGSKYSIGGVLNNFAWEAVFKQNNVPEKEIKIVLEWMKYILEEYRLAMGMYPQLWVDTYSNLLYKYGFIFSEGAIQSEIVERAIFWENQAIEVSSSPSIIKRFNDNIDKMKTLLMTW